jgi:hypothetical protein
MVNRLLYTMLMLCPLFAFCQERQIFNGHVVAGNLSVAGVFVINKATSIETKTDNNGNFTIPARTGDYLVVYNSSIDVREFYISDITFKQQPYTMEVKPSAYELKEVVINNNVSAQSLGIVPKNQKRYTPAERRLYTASDWKPSFSVGTTAGVVIPTDFIINAINGRTKMLKKAVKTENKEVAIDKINGLYTEQEVVDELGIPAEYVQGFLFFAVEDVACAKALKSKNDDLSKLMLMELAKKYLVLIKDE